MKLVFSLFSAYNVSIAEKMMHDPNVIYGRASFSFLSEKKNNAVLLIYFEPNNSQPYVTYVSQWSISISMFIEYLLIN